LKDCRLTDMKQITQNLCKRCKYHTVIGQGGHTVACYYVVRKSHSRGEPVGFCTHFEKGIPEPLNFNDRERL